MKLLELQQTFTLLVTDLINFIHSKGYQLTFGEAYRPKETAELYAQKGIGSANSLHCSRLAIDLNLFKDGQWLKDSESFEQFGKYWKSLSTCDFETAWGGDWGDGNHFSIAYGGRK